MKQSLLKSFCRASGAGPTDVAFSKSSTPAADAPADMMFGTAQAAPQSNQNQNPPNRLGRLQTTVLAQNLRRLISTCEIFALVGIGLFNWSSTARAAYPLVVDDAGVHSPGTADLDFFADGQRTPTSENIDAHFWGTVGLFPRVEGWVGVGYGWTRDRSPENAPTQDGLLDVNVGFKGSIVPADAGPLAVSLSVNAKLPTADADLGLGTGFTDLSVNAIGTKTWGDLSLDLNMGYGWTAVGDRAEQDGDALFTGFALRWQTTKRLMLFAETFGIFPTDGDTDPFGTVRAGGQLELYPSVLLGAAIGTGYGNDAPEALGTIGLTVRF